MTAALQAGRVSALVASEGCQPDEYVLKRTDEQQFQDTSKNFVHIQWRSVSEIFDYLGAVLRYQARNNTAISLVWPDDNKQDATIQHDLTLNTNTAQPLDQISTPTNRIFFAVYSTGSSDIRVSYNGESVAPDIVNARQPTDDNTFLILSMLTTLVDYTSQPTTISTSAPLRLLPIP